MNVEKWYLTLTNQLHEGRDILLSQLILGSLYESLGLATEALKNLEPNDNLFLAGPYWLLCLWLNKMFELSLDVEKPNDTDEPINNKRVEGTWLAQITLDEKNRSDQDAFFELFPYVHQTPQRHSHKGSFRQQNSWAWVVLQKVSCHWREGGLIKESTGSFPHTKSSFDQTWDIQRKSEDIMLSTQSSVTPIMS